MVYKIVLNIVNILICLWGSLILSYLLITGLLVSWFNQLINTITNYALYLVWFLLQFIDDFLILHFLQHPAYSKILAIWCIRKAI